MSQSNLLTSIREHSLFVMVGSRELKDRLITNVSNATSTERLWMGARVVLTGANFAAAALEVFGKGPASPVPLALDLIFASALSYYSIGELFGKSGEARTSLYGQFCEAARHGNIEKLEFLSPKMKKLQWAKIKAFFQEDLADKVWDVDGLKSPLTEANNNEQIKAVEWLLNHGYHQRKDQLSLDVFIQQERVELFCTALRFVRPIEEDPLFLMECLMELSLKERAHPNPKTRQAIERMTHHVFQHWSEDLVQLKKEMGTYNPGETIYGETLSAQGAEARISEMKKLGGTQPTLKDKTLGFLSL